MPESSMTFRNWFSPHAPRALVDRRASLRLAVEAPSSVI